MSAELEPPLTIARFVARVVGYTSPWLILPIFVAQLNINVLSASLAYDEFPVWFETPPSYAAILLTLWASLQFGRSAILPVGCLAAMLVVEIEITSVTFSASDPLAIPGLWLALRYGLSPARVSLLWINARRSAWDVACLVMMTFVVLSVAMPGLTLNLSPSAPIVFLLLLFAGVRPILPLALAFAAGSALALMFGAHVEADGPVEMTLGADSYLVQGILAPTLGYILVGLTLTGRPTGRRFGAILLAAMLGKSLYITPMFPFEDGFEPDIRFSAVLAHGHLAAVLVAVTLRCFPTWSLTQWSLRVWAALAGFFGAAAAFSAGLLRSEDLGFVEKLSELFYPPTISTFFFVENPSNAALITSLASALAHVGVTVGLTWMVLRALPDGDLTAGVRSGESPVSGRLAVVFTERGVVMLTFAGAFVVVLLVVVKLLSMINDIA